MKNFGLLPAAFLFLSATVSAQIGVNTTAPKTTMDVSAKRDTSGNIVDNTQLIGLQAPRLTRAELTANTATYGTNQQGAQIYITDVSGGTAAGQRVNITTTGYYTFDGTLWQKMQDTNIYTGDGTLTGNRTLTQGGKSLRFLGSDQETQWTTYGYLMQKGLTSSIYGDASIGATGADQNGNGHTTRLYFQAFPDSSTQIQATGEATSLAINTNATDAASPIVFSTSPGGGALGVQRMLITGTGNIGINTATPTEKLDNGGITRLRTLPLNGAANAINTNSSGNASASQDQTFTATRTVVADANGVLGYVTGLPSTSGGGGALSVGSSITATYSVPNATATVGSGNFRLGAYVTANGLTPLPTIDGIQMDLLGNDSTYYNPIIENVSSSSLLISYQSFATQVNENRTNLNQTLSPCPFAATTFTGNWNDGNNAAGWRGVDQNNIVFWNTANAEVETTNLQVQVNATTYRWYELKWWCMEVSGQKKIFLSLTRKV
ncbi:hypothetical protein GCM10022217_24210 [Chryseobacterium ginsenosidimutans]|uniref:hypothetical protein n=1 Tax=Chryseobacterium ginsenosidimutans TaxID=687846 RepID=UPI0031D39A6B